MYYVAVLLMGLAISPVFTRDEAFDGPCPDIDYIKKFDQKQVNGPWYVIQRYASGFNNCATRQYSWLKHNRIMSEAFVEKSDDFEVARGGESSLIETESGSDEGKFFAADDRKKTYYFVDTDSSYLVVWTCYQEINKNFQNLMVMARDRHFDINSSEALNATLAKQPFDRSKLKHVEQKDQRCYL